MTTLAMHKPHPDRGMESMGDVPIPEFLDRGPSDELVRKMLLKS